ncbi:hypothetical protein SLA2020_405240 [Shorea laevis]
MTPAIELEMVSQMLWHYYPQPHHALLIFLAGEIQGNLGIKVQKFVITIEPRVNETKVLMHFFFRKCHSVDSSATFWWYNWKEESTLGRYV